MLSGFPEHDLNWLLRLTPVLSSIIFHKHIHEKSVRVSLLHLAICSCHLLRPSDPFLNSIKCSVSCSPSNHHPERHWLICPMDKLCKSYPPATDIRHSWTLMGFQFSFEIKSCYALNYMFLVAAQIMCVLYTTFTGCLPKLYQNTNRQMKQ